MMKYLQEIPKGRLAGAMVLSAPFSSSKCIDAWKGRWIHENVYDKHFLDKFKGGFIRLVYSIMYFIMYSQFHQESRSI